MFAPSPADSEAAPSPAALTRFLMIVGFCGFASALSMRTLDPVMPLIAVEFERSVVEVAQRAGFGDDERMRRAFLRHLGVSPSEYRRRFSG